MHVVVVRHGHDAVLGLRPSGGSRRRSCRRACRRACRGGRRACGSASRRRRARSAPRGTRSTGTVDGERRAARRRVLDAAQADVEVAARHRRVDRRELHRDEPRARPSFDAMSAATSTSKPTTRAGSRGSASTYGEPPSGSPPQRSSPAAGAAAGGARGAAARVAAPRPQHGGSTARRHGGQEAHGRGRRGTMASMRTAAAERPRARRGNGLGSGRRSMRRRRSRLRRAVAATSLDISDSRRARIAYVRLALDPAVVRVPSSYAAGCRTCGRIVASCDEPSSCGSPGRGVLPPLVRSACSGKSGRATTIAVVPKGTTHEFWKSVHAGAVKAGRELGVEILWQGPLKEDDREDQIKVVDTLVVARHRRHAARAARRQGAAPAGGQRRARGHPGA